ncbi:hypothetical protein [Psychrobacter sp. DM4]|uniref:hypothetical protein n=1 Tax=Psychrobacter sp. DM4 TaxID=3440637 RepID=UPI003F4FF77F
MLTIVIWAAGAALLLVNIILRTRILRLEARLRELSDPKEQLLYLRQQAANTNKVASIKALRKKYPELTLIDANKLWQQL